MDASLDNAQPGSWSVQSIFTTPRAENQFSCPPNKALGNLALSGIQIHRLETGFKVQQGARLKVRIEDCN